MYIKHQNAFKNLFYDVLKSIFNDISVCRLLCYKHQAKTDCGIFYRILKVLLRFCDFIIVTYFTYFVLDTPALLFLLV